MGGESVRQLVKKYRKKHNLLPHREEKVSKDVQRKLNEIDLKINELKREKVMLSDQRREYNKIIREQARQENLYKELNYIVDNINQIKPLFIKDIDVREGNKQGLLLCGDFHYGLFVDNYWNNYNPDVFFDRIDTLVSKTITYCKNNNVNILNIMFLGDAISGNIHKNLQVKNTEDVIQQTEVVAETISNMLCEFARQHFKVKFYSVTGNHGRVQPKKEESIEEENFERFIPWYIKARTNEIDNLEIIDNKVDDDIITAKIFDKLIVGVHGHYDVKNINENLSMMLKEIPYMVVKGHEHHYKEENINDIPLVSIGSLCGSDDYSKSIRKINKPEQSLIIFGKDGRECDYHIML